jgi:hypothetical protein
MASKFSKVDEVSEATIAVHWHEEGYYGPSVQFIRQANLTDPDVHERFSLDNFPECFKEYADLLTAPDLVQILGKDSGYEQCAVLAMVSRRQD